jgi:hypothetical protein
MQPDSYITLPTPDGPIILPVFSPPSCMWLVPDMTGDGPDAIGCGAHVSGRKCGAGHLQTGAVTALNSGAPEFS